MRTVPRLSIGLPVYNGEEYLAESLDALLGQSYDDFELIITDNASTDGTEAICRRYVRADSRVRYERLTKNVGAANNHNHVFSLTRGELFKWASHDDLYGRDLLRRCVEALDAHPELILAHAWSASVDADGKIIEPFDYTLATDSPSAPERFASLLFAPGGDDFYGVMRADLLRRVKPHASYHHADRTYVAEIAMHGPFHQVPELLYFRRDHPTRAERANPTVRSRCANLDPRRGNRFLHPAPRLLAEYVWGFVDIVRRAPITADEQRECYRHLRRWLTSRARAGVGASNAAMGVASESQPLSIDGIVPGHGVRSS
ncbi:glycosyltransferase family 2 protein [Actinophytocola sp.]|uniref:glycosyltransferase family 2 protein n=1 Tax=Actinophytocola sp. TaxID=1872138 RepID=UPI003D6BCAA2